MPIRFTLLTYVQTVIRSLVWLATGASAELEMKCIAIPMGRVDDWSQSHESNDDGIHRVIRCTPQATGWSTIRKMCIVGA